jgi:hypothetical protein
MGRADSNNNVDSRVRLRTTRAESPFRSASLDEEPFDVFLADRVLPDEGEMHSQRLLRRREGQRQILLAARDYAPLARSFPGGVVPRWSNLKDGYDTGLVVRDRDSEADSARVKACK